jgi:UDP-glucose 4-epimerase
MTSAEPRHVLITGGAGFIGSHLAEALLAAGDTVTAIDNLSTGSMGNLGHLAGRPGFQFVRASITDSIVLDRLASQASVIVHLAAAVGVQLIVERPVQTIETNVMGAEAVLRAALRYGCHTLIASSSEVYGKGTRIPFSEEDDVMLGATSHSRWAYAASKMVDEFLALAYGREYGLPVTIFRLFNTVGPRQTGHYGMVIPRFVGQAVKGEAVTVYGTGAQTRCFCYVGDVVDALVKLSEHPEAVGRVFNLGGSQEISIDALAHRVIELAGSDSKVRYVSYEEAYEEGFEDMQRRVPDTTRARELIGFEPTVDLDGILRSVIADQRG